MAPANAQRVGGPRLRAPIINDAPMFSRIFYHLRKVRNRMRQNVPEPQQNVLPRLVETINPVEVRNAFRVLCDEGDNIVNDEHLDILLEDHPEKVKNAIKKIPKLALNVKVQQAVRTEMVDVIAADLVEIDIPIADRFELKSDKERITPAPRMKREYRKAVEAVVNKDIYYYMKIKYFMKERTPGMVQQLVNDCRVYLTKNGSKMDTEEDYNMVSSLVLAVWLPSKEELRFRSAMKNATVLDGINAINQFHKGNLGTANRFTNPTPNVSRPGLLRKRVTLNQTE